MMGMTSYEAKHQTPEQVRRQGQHQRLKWGGTPHLGSQPWIRREIARTSWA